MKVLVVDDLPEGRELLGSVLSKNGFAVAMAMHGAEALEITRREHPDLIIADIMMPMMDGFALCRAVKADPALQRIPVVFYTATYTDADDEELALTLGASRFIRKPQDPSQFVAMIREVLEAGERGALTRALPEADPIVELQLYNARLVAKLEKKLTELQALEEQHRMVTENMADALFVLDHAGRFSHANRAAEVLSGYSREEMSDLTFMDLLIPASHEQVRDRLQRASAGEDVEPHFETELVKKNGQRIPIELMVTSIWKEGVVVGRLAVARDISERKQMQARLIQVEKLSALGLLLSGVAHELNNPLSVLLAGSELLLKDLETERNRRTVSTMHRAAQRATRIVQGLLLFSRKRRPARSLVSVNDLLDQTIELFSHQFRTDGVGVEKLYDAQLPRLFVDPHQLQQVFINILSNAHQALREATTARRLTLRTELIDQHVRISFSDTGPGIPAEIRERIFEPFFTTKPPGTGTGLGLSVCFSIVQEHGGSIDVESDPGIGTTFTVTLPIGQREAPSVADKTPRIVGEMPAKTIAIVDDEASVGETLGAMLESLGHRVTVYDSGEAAIADLLAGRFDLILLDLRMPGLDGPALYRLLHSHEPRLAERIIFLTGDVVSPESEAFLEQTGNLYLLKPFTLNEVQQLLATALGRTPSSGD